MRRHSAFTPEVLGATSWPFCCVSQWNNDARYCLRKGIPRFNQTFSMVVTLVLFHSSRAYVYFFPTDIS